MADQNPEVHRRARAGAAPPLVVAACLVAGAVVAGAGVAAAAPAGQGGRTAGNPSNADPNGKHAKSDQGRTRVDLARPLAVSTPGTLTEDKTVVEQGEQITFHYTVTAEKVSAKNWIGLYSNPGNGPVNQVYVGPSTVWQYVDGSSGGASFGTSSLSPGTYIAFYLYNDGYTWLAQPVTFTVKPVPPVPPPVYAGDFGYGLSQPSGITTDPEGNLVVADTGHNRVDVYTPRGRRIRSIGRLKAPTAVATDSKGDIYVADTGNNRVQVFSPKGRYVRNFGNGWLDNPHGIAVDAQGNVYVGDTGNNRVIKFTGTGSYPSSIGSLAAPHGVRLDSNGDVWVVQSGNHDSGPDEVTQFSPAGKKLQSLGASQTSGFGGMSNPTDVALDRNGHIYVAVPDYSLVETFASFGPYLNEFGTDGRGLLANAQSLTVGRDGLIYVADTGNDRIVIFKPATPDPATPDPATANPVTPGPVTSKAATRNSVTSKPLAFTPATVTMPATSGKVS